MDETVAVGEVVFTSVALTDADKGENARVQLSCQVPREGADDGACDTFDIRAQELTPGSYVGLISLKRPLDYEARSSYNMLILAQDSGADTQLTSTTNVLIQVNDIQDQKPFFVNAPYSATVQENTPPVRRTTTTTVNTTRSRLSISSSSQFQLPHSYVMPPFELPPDLGEMRHFGEAKLFLVKFDTGFVRQCYCSY